MQTNLHFRGPFTLTAGERCLFQCPLAKAACVYLWTVKSEVDARYWIHYVGETTNLAARHREHLCGVLSLNYGIFDAPAARKGIQQRLWSGLWRDKTPDASLKQLTAYATITGDVLRYVECLAVFVAATDVEELLRKHIEGSIGWNLRKNHHDFKVLYPDDNHIGTMAPQGIRLMISADEQIAGLDQMLDI